jgi:hypothetical protein
MDPNGIKPARAQPSPNSAAEAPSDSPLIRIAQSRQKLDIRAEEHLKLDVLFHRNSS